MDHPENQTIRHVGCYCICRPELAHKVDDISIFPTIESTCPRSMEQNFPDVALDFTKVPLHPSKIIAVEGSVSFQVIMTYCGGRQGAKLDHI